MTQEIIVALIGIIVALIVVFKLYRFFFTKNEQKNSCGCSSCGCSTKYKQVKY
ncbi:MAG: FeoB-associated Cys-rich membrane protein [Prevotella sp.]|nr:FeoB-associated Cys-rich membrane protein [Prevotella sp.]